MFRKKEFAGAAAVLMHGGRNTAGDGVCCGAICAGKSRWSGYGNQVMWDKPANGHQAASYLEYEAQLVLNGQVLQTESVEIDRWVFFDSKNITQSKDAYTLKVRARQIYLLGDPERQLYRMEERRLGRLGNRRQYRRRRGSYPPHEHSFGGWKK